jgi:stage IV sporulation protein FB
MLSFNLFGIPVRVQPWFWVTLALIGGGLSANDSLSMLLVVIFVLAGFVSVLVHELGHALTVRKFGLPTSITLIAFGGFASYPAGVLTRKQSFMVTAAGPALQLALGILVAAIRVSVEVPAASLLNHFTFCLVLVSVAWALLNCLPIFPMDGGQMLAAVLGPKRQRYVYLTGAICAAIIGLLAFTQLSSYLLPIFMAYFAWKNWQSFRQHTN